eukprot:gene8627-biopygen5972
MAWAATSNSSSGGHIGAPQGLAHAVQALSARSGTDVILRLARCADEVCGAEVHFAALAVDASDNGLREPWPKARLVQHRLDKGSARLATDLPLLVEAVHIGAELQLVGERLLIGAQACEAHDNGVVDGVKLWDLC